MSLYLDTLFLNEISFQFGRFTRKEPYLYNCRCPYCGDSKKNPEKARGFFYKNDNSLTYKCHNCGVSASFANVLKRFNPESYLRYCKESFGVKEKPVEIKPFPKSEKRIELEHRIDVRWPFLQSVSKLPKDHISRTYLDGRHIFEHDLFYFVERTKLLNDIAPKYKDKWSHDEPRLVIPFRNSKHEVVGFICRALTENKIRYVMAKIEEEEDLIFGIDRVDFTKPAYIVEGPLDSLFLPNAVAAGGTSLDKVVPYFGMSTFTMILDNQPRNKDLIKIIRKEINNGHSVCIWPEDLKEKDINEMILSGKSKEEVLELIKSRTFFGLFALVKFNEWKKC